MITAAQMIGWAVRRADGTVIVEIGPEVTEHQIWRIALGWPTVGEVKREKAQGGRSFRCKLVEIEPRA
jgi:hypothetical protein